MDCRIGCGGCCIAPSISSPLPGMPQGKPAGVRCVNLDENYRCRLWGSDRYPDVCRDFPADYEVCGDSRREALERLTEWERLTAPPPKATTSSAPAAH